MGTDPTRQPGVISYVKLRPANYPVSVSVTVILTLWLSLVNYNYIITIHKLSVEEKHDA